MMTLDEFFEHFCEELEVDDLTTIDITSDFKNVHGWDSIVALQIIAMVEEEFEISINGNDIMKSKTIEDLYKLIESKYYEQ